MDHALPSVASTYASTTATTMTHGDTGQRDASAPRAAATATAHATAQGHPSRRSASVAWRKSVSDATPLDRHGKAEAPLIARDQSCLARRQFQLRAAGGSKLQAVNQEMTMTARGGFSGRVQAKRAHGSGTEVHAAHRSERARRAPSEFCRARRMCVCAWWCFARQHFGVQRRAPSAFLHAPFLLSASLAVTLIYCRARVKLVAFAPVCIFLFHSHPLCL